VAVAVAGGTAQLRAHQRQRQLTGKKFVIGKPRPGEAFGENVGRRRRAVQLTQAFGKCRQALARNPLVPDHATADALIDDLSPLW